MNRANKIQLKSLKLKGYRGFRKEIELSFDEHLTVLIGNNGAGKTSILDAIADFLYWFRHGVTGEKIDRYVFPKLLPSGIKSFKNYDVNNYEERFENELMVTVDTIYEEIDDDGDKKDIESSKVTFLSMSAEKDTTVDISRHDNENILQTFTNYLYTSKLNKTLYDIPILAYYEVDSFNTNLDLKNIFFAASDIFDAYHNALESDDFNFTNFFVWYDKRQKIQLQQGKSLTLDTIESVVTQILEDEDYTFKNLRIVWGDYFDEMIVDKINKKTGAKDELVINQLSSGEKTLLVLVVDLAYRLCLANPKNDKPLKGNGIVLIDEIDLHLHPKWQQKVVIKLRKIFPNVQFVVTTHSPLVLTSIKAESVRVIRNNQIHRVQELYPDFKNYGANPQKIIQLLQEVEDYMPEEVKTLFKEYFKAIDKGDFATAKEIKEDKLEKLTDKNHPKILEGQAEIEFQQITNSL